MFVCLSVCLFVCLSVCLFVCLFVCPTIFYETVRDRKVKFCFYTSYLPPKKPIEFGAN